MGDTPPTEGADVLAEIVTDMEPIAPLVVVAVSCVVPGDSPVTWTLLPLALMDAIEVFPILQVMVAFEIGFPEPSYAVAAAVPEVPAERFNEEGVTTILAAEPVAGEPTCSGIEHRANT